MHRHYWTCWRTHWLVRRHRSGSKAQQQNPPMCRPNNAIWECPTWEASPTYGRPDSGPASYAKVFLKLDANAGFWKIGLTRVPALLTAFFIPVDRFCFKHLPVGLSSALEYFQRWMSQILDGLNRWMTSACMIPHRKDITETCWQPSNES